MYCPICLGKSTATKRCPGCRSLPRHRHIHRAIGEHGVMAKLPGARVLLVGGSPAEVTMLNVARKLERMTHVNPNHGGINMDLANMHLFDDGSFDFVFACHVLEHVKKLEEGLTEVLRILKPGGAAVLCVPIARKKKSVLLSYPVGPGHWWKIGLDWQDRYRAVGFQVATSTGWSCPSSYVVKPDNLVSICVKPRERS